jgi:hypothetical protein
MRIWKIIAIGSALGATLLFTIVRHSSTAADHAKDGSLAATRVEARQVTAPTKEPEEKKSYPEYNWPPFSKTDW